MNWFKVAKNKTDFDFGDEKRSLWRNFVKMEQDSSNINFDLENDDSVGNIRNISIDNGPKQDHIDTLVVMAEMWSAGGDWECPVRYFKCQVKENGRPDRKFIYIPNRREGNVNLVKTDDGEGYAAKHSEGNNDCGEFKDKQLWDALKRHIPKRMKEHHAAYQDGYDKNPDKEFLMYNDLTAPFANDLKEEWKHD